MNVTRVKKLSGHKVYVVTFDGYCRGYGSYIYLLGVYNALDKSYEAIEKAIKESGNILNQDNFAITESEINKSLELRNTGTEEYPDFETDVALGGFAE